MKLRRFTIRELQRIPTKEPKYKIWKNMDMYNRLGIMQAMNTLDRIHSYFVAAYSVRTMESLLCSG